MSFCAIKWTYMSPHVLNAGLNPTELAVLRALCWFYNDKNRIKTQRNCFVSVEKLAKTIGKSPDAVDRAKNTLCEKGLVRWDRAQFDEHGFKTNNYHIFCPELEKILERNAKKRAEALPPNEDNLDIPHPLQPGVLYDRPNPETLVTAFSKTLNQSEAEWMADALAFVCDNPENRSSLYAKMRDAPGLDTCRKALGNCVRTSQNGRAITKRIGYLLAAMERQTSSQQG